MAYKFRNAETEMSTRNISRTKPEVGAPMPYNLMFDYLFIWSFHHYFQNIKEWTSNRLDMLILHFIENNNIVT